MVLPAILAVTGAGGWFRELTTRQTNHTRRRHFMAPNKFNPRAEVQAELINALFRPAPIILIIHAVTSMVLVLMLWPLAPHDQLLGWLIFVYSLIVARGFLVYAYRRRRPTLEKAPRWGIATTMLSGLFGLTWGAVPILFLDAGQPSLIIITVALIGLNTQALMAVVSYPPAYFASILTLLCLIVVLLWRGGALGVEITVLLTLNLVASLFYANNIYRALNNSLHLTFENASLRRETEEKSALLEAILQNMQQGISVVDQEGRLRMWNQRFVDLFHLNERKIENGQYLHTLLPTTDLPLAQFNSSQIEHRDAAGNVIDILQNVMPDGGRVLTYTDISDLKRREAALETARQVAERANAAKTRFLAAASHDLRQPIHALGLFFAKLADQVCNSNTELLIKQIEDAIDAIDSMLNALLDISKLDAGIIHPNIGSVSVAGLFKRLESEYQTLARETGNVLKVRPCQARVKSDPALLECILRNLISNALRYTEDGRVLVAARYRGDRLRLEVYDTGPGIPADQLEDIFLEFHQLQRSERDRRPGLGLGLAIVKRVASLLGHEIEVLSRLGHGSRFAVTVPLAEEVPASRPLSIPLAPTLGLQGCRVLVLDDDPAVLQAMGGLLESWGCNVIMAASLEEAQAKLQTGVQPPELLIVDYRLRGKVSGLEAVAILHQQLSRYVPALVITADTAPDCLREAEASGYPLLHKPVQPAKLHSAVRYLVSLRGMNLR